MNFKSVTKSFSKSQNWIWALAGVAFLWYLSRLNPPLLTSPTQLTQGPNPLAGKAIA